jgi:hypothetical protein
MMWELMIYVRRSALWIVGRVYTVSIDPVHTVDWYVIEIKDLMYHWINILKLL